MLSTKQLNEFEQQMNQIRQAVADDLGQRDADYIRRIIRFQRISEITGRLCLFLGFLHPLFWVLGVAALSVSKILDNMEIGHNVMHGQYDWMNDPHINSKTFEWDNVCDGESWRRTHNYEHHTYTNILGKDRDYGYDVLRLTHEQKWSWGHGLQFFHYLILSLVFEWGVALHELEIEEIKQGRKTWKEKLPFLKGLAKKGSRQVFKDYVFFPLLAGPFFLQVMAGNLVANLIRNLWSSTIIFCGHFPDGVHTFTEEECENESKGHWYYRQMLGSANFQGSRFLHIMSGHLSFQIEHHLFPDIPAHRYAEMSPKVEALAKQYGLQYNTGNFWKQYMTVVKRILVHSLPEPRSIKA
jgi:fatty acid desaturase